jgi:[heparan sulfate]-glucosamine 3-sulfotransferase 1
MPLAHNGQMTIEKSPSYFTSLEAPHRIYAMNKKIKLVLAVREPVERLLSYYSFKAYL